MTDFRDILYFYPEKKNNKSSLQETYFFNQGVSFLSLKKQEGHDGPVSLHWLIREIHSYQTLHYLGIGLKHKTPYKD